MTIARLIIIKQAYQLTLRIKKQLRTTKGRKLFIDLILGCYVNSSFQRPLTKNELTKGDLTSEQGGKAKVPNKGAQCYKCKGLGHFAMVNLVRNSWVIKLAKVT